MTTFELQGHDYIQLNQLLKLLNMVESGGEANQVITAGLVEVNGQTELQKRKKLYPGDKASYDGELVEIIKGKNETES
jgi:ribosome-associated protein